MPLLLLAPACVPLSTPTTISGLPGLPVAPSRQRAAVLLWLQLHPQRATLRGHEHCLDHTRGNTANKTPPPGQKKALKKLTEMKANIDELAKEMTVYEKAAWRPPSLSECIVVQGHGYKAVRFEQVRKGRNRRSPPPVGKY